jgi:hypothetical protein
MNKRTDELRVFKFNNYRAVVAGLVTPNLRPNQLIMKDIITPGAEAKSYIFEYIELFYNR